MRNTIDNQKTKLRILGTLLQLIMLVMLKSLKSGSDTVEQRYLERWLTKLDNHDGFQSSKEDGTGSRRFREK